LDFSLFLFSLVSFDVVIRTYIYIYYI
jgi:hypothetical protein